MSERSEDILLDLTPIMLTDFLSHMSTSWSCLYQSKQLLTCKAPTEQLICMFS